MSDLISLELADIRRRLTVLESLEVPNVRPAFAVHKNGTNQTGIVTTTFTKITWSTELLDTNSNFASDRFTPTIAGNYLFTCTVLMNNILEDQKQVLVSLYKNGSRTRESRIHTSGTSYQAITLTTILAANGSSDYFETYIYHECTANQTVVGDPLFTYWQGALIG